MLRWLLPAQFDELVEGPLGALGLDAAEAHLDACSGCRQQFLAHTLVADAAEWRRAAWELPAPTGSEAALLTELKTLDAEPAVECVGRAADHADLVDGDSRAVQFRPDLPAARTRGARWPTVPGFEILGELGRGGM